MKSHVISILIPIKNCNPDDIYYVTQKVTSLHNMEQYAMLLARTDPFMHLKSSKTIVCKSKTNLLLYFRSNSYQ